VREPGASGRTYPPIPRAFDSGPLTRAAFSMTTEQPLPEEPVQLGDDWFIYRLKDRTEATEEGFTDEVRQRITDELLSVKRIEAIRAYVGELRDAAEDTGAIRVDEAILQYGDEAADEDEDGAGEGEGEAPAPAPEEESALPRRRSAVPA